MRPTIVEQDGIRITQIQPDSVVIEMNSFSITLTEENTDLLRVMLYEAYRSKSWKKTRAEKSARNKVLYSLAKAQGKKKPDIHTEKTYERMKEKADDYAKNDIEFILPDYDISFLDVELPDFLDVESLGQKQFRKPGEKGREKPHY